MEVKEDLLVMISDRYRQFSKGQKRLAEYITKNYVKAIHMTAARLGHEAGVSESTVVRFASELGFKGYPQLQRSLTETVNNRLNTIQRMTMAEDIPEIKDVLRTVLTADLDNVRRTLNEADTDAFMQAVSMLDCARRIFIAAERSSEMLGMFMHYYMRYITDDVRLVSNAGLAGALEDVMRIGSDDVIVGISFPRYSMDTVRILSYAKRCGAGVIALTDSPQSPMTAFSDCNLYAKTNMVSLADSLAAPMSVISSLVTALGLKNRDRSHAAMQQLEAIWQEFDVYQNSAAPSAGR